MSRPWLVLFLLSVCLSAAPRLAHAQTASLTGYVVDASGANVPGAAVTAVNTETALSRDVRTAADGSYVIPLLPPGRYLVLVEKEGFRNTQREDVQLAVDTQMRLDVTLEVGGLEQSVTVTAKTTLLQDTPNLGASITRQELERLPLFQVGRNRSPASFVYLVPGVQGSVASSGTDDTSASNVTQYHGGQIRTNDIWFEGVPAGQTHWFGSFNESAPSVDAISEFRVQTSLLSAEYGLTGAGVMTFSLKSGTNQFHGSAFEYFRDDALDTKSVLATSKPENRQNEFGATIGGPVLRDRTFFFFSYGAARKRGGVATFTQSRIPTPANLTGDFSGLRDASGQLIPIYDPQTRQPFPGNIIPADRIDPAAARIAALFPAPNASGTQNLTGFTGEPRLDPTNVAFKIEHQLTPTQRLSGSGVTTHIPREVLSSVLPAPLTTATFQQIDARTWRVNHTAVLSSSMVNSLHVGYNRFPNDNGAFDRSTDWPQQLGIPEFSNVGFPSITFGSGYAGIGSSGRNLSDDKTWIIKDQLSAQRGSHELMVGGEMRFTQYDAVLTDSGSFTFSNRGTADPARLATTGDPIASFLLGHVDSASYNAALTTRERRNYYGVFVQDTWRVRPDVTITAGLRWEALTPPWERDNRYGLVDLTAQNPGAGNVPGAVAYAGDGVSRTFIDTNYRSFGPRVGLAWRPQTDTVVRGGYGIYYTLHDLGLSSPGFRAAAVAVTPDNGLTPGLVLRQGFTGVPARDSVSPTVWNGQNGTYLEPSSGALPRMHNWTVGVQRELGGWTASASYVGMRYTNMVSPNLANINQVDASYLSLGSLLTANINSPAARAAGIPIPYPGFNGSVAQALRPYPQYLTLTSAAAKLADSTYHGVELQVAKRLSAGLTLQANYVYSHSYGLTPDRAGNGVTVNTPQDANDLDSERSIGAADIPHALVVNYAYDLPFGAGRRWLNGSGVLDALVGGWTIAGAHRYQSGAPMSVVMNNTLPIFNRSLRPDLVPGVSPTEGVSYDDFNQATDRMLNPAAFAAPAAFTFGNAPVRMDDLRMPATLAEDLAITKRLPEIGRTSLELYVQIKNVFNRLRWAAPDLNFSSANFGRATAINIPRFIQLGARFTF